MSPRTVDKRVKRKEILRAALRVFASKGIGHFRMIEIANAAGIGKGTLYEYFPSKNDLILGCFRDLMEEWDNAIDSRLSESSDPVSRVRMVISATFEFLRAEQDRIDALFDFYAMGIPRRDGKPALIEISPLYGGMIRKLGRIIENGIAAGHFRPVNPDLAASIILGLLDGLLFQIALRVVGFDDRELEGQVGDIVLGGLLQHRSG